MPTIDKFNKFLAVFLIGVLLAACQTPPPPLLNLISYGQVINGKLGLNENHYIFQGDSGDVVDVECSVGGQPFLVVVLDAKNNVLAQSSGTFTLPDSGQYTIVVTTGTGDYTLS